MKALFLTVALLLCVQLASAYWYGPGMGMYPGMYGYGYGPYGMHPGYMSPGQVLRILKFLL